MIRSIVALLSARRRADRFRRRRKRSRISRSARAPRDGRQLHGSGTTRWPSGATGRHRDPIQFAITYQSFTQYEGRPPGQRHLDRRTGAAEQGLLDPPISPSFRGAVVRLGEGIRNGDLLAYIRPFQIK